MDDGQLLLRQILETPEDDTVRLVYADWLQEQGDKNRAEYIRWAIGYHSLDWEAIDPDIQAEIYMAYDKSEGVDEAWFSFQLPEEFDCHWDRGFLEWFSCRWQFIRDERQLRRMFSFHPIERIRLLDVHPSECRLLKWGWGFPIGRRWRRLDALPLALASLLPGGELGRIELNAPHRVTDGVWFPTGNAAVEALSIGVIRYGRQLVGLPDLLACEGG